MDLKNTKVTVQNFTVAPSLKQSQAFITERHSAGLKNIYNPHQLGVKAEDCVKDIFIKHGWAVVSERKKYDGVEIDLVVESNKRIVILEVKRLDNAWRAFERVSLKQIQRLKYVALGFREREKIKSVEVYLAFVLTNKKLHFVPLDD